MRLIEKEGLSFYQFDLFRPYPELKHGVFTRKGLPGHTSDFNLAFNDQDNPEDVLANIRRAEAVLGLTRTAFVRQNHSNRIFRLRPADGYHPEHPDETSFGYDALLALEPGQNLMIKLADCQGVILYEPASRALALIHSGWRGSVQNIIGRTVEAMREDLGLNPACLLAAISPSLGPCCAEFRNYRQELPEEFHRFQVRPNYFDFWAVSRRQLTEAGLRPENIETASICTKCQPGFFSYRGGDRRSRFGILAGAAPFC